MLKEEAHQLKERRRVVKCIDWVCGGTEYLPTVALGICWVRPLSQLQNLVSKGHFTHEPRAVTVKL